MENKTFVLNPQNGFWGLACEQGIDGLKEHLASLEKPKREYNGIQLIALNTSTYCNQRCVYCYIDPSHPYFNTPIAIGRQTVDRALELEHVPKIVFHGSEPLFNFDLIKDSVEYAERISPNRKISFFVQSNLTLLKDHHLDFFIDHNVSVSSSLDGFESQHNLNRPLRSGEPSYPIVIENIRKVIDRQKGIHVITVVTKNNVHALDELVLDYERKGITSVQFNPPIDFSGNANYLPGNALLADSYLKLFQNSFNRILKGEQKIKVNNLVQYLSALFVNSGTDSCRLCTSSNEHPIIAVDFDGEIYPCDFYFGRKNLSLGNISQNSFSSIMNSEKNPRLQCIKADSCQDCRWTMLCGGGCLADTLNSRFKPYYCGTHKTIFEYLSSKAHFLVESGLAKRILSS